ncbi:hypothetical protein VNO77_43955 [Canavalia gladiata]|uniref:Uncharacterized protein n=1 Tax=Canavalia gladiata TaxID=3824 RepID=A0AAN9JX68_CANGL
MGGLVWQCIGSAWSQVHSASRVIFCGCVALPSIHARETMEPQPLRALAMHKGPIRRRHETPSENWLLVRRTKVKEKKRRLRMGVWENCRKEDQETSDQTLPLLKGGSDIPLEAFAYKLLTRFHSRIRIDISNHDDIRRRYAGCVAKINSSAHSLHRV